MNTGEIFGLLGPNGAGKNDVRQNSSLDRLALSGPASIFNEPLGSRTIRRKSGYLPENHRYLSFLTGLETLLMFGKMHGLNTRTLRDKAHCLLQMVGLKEWKKVKIKKYSKGMLQRLGLAQALLNEPEIMFLDEPTDGVDPVGRKEIWDVLRDLRSRGTTIFLNSHILSEVELICDRVAILNKGQIIKVGSVDSITQKEDEYEIRLGVEVSEEMLGQVHTIVVAAEREGTLLRIVARNREEMNRVLDYLGAKGIPVESITHRKSTLEESFIQIIRSEPS